MVLNLLDYTDLVNECGGAEPEVVEAELALNGKDVTRNSESCVDLREGLRD